MSTACRKEILGVDASKMAEGNIATRDTRFIFLNIFHVQIKVGKLLTFGRGGHDSVTLHDRNFPPTQKDVLPFRARNGERAPMHFISQLSF